MSNFKKNLSNGILIGLVCAVALSFAKFDARCEELRHNILRLHIIANSDSEADQALKLAVRDSILENTQTVFDSCTDLQSAVEAAQSEMEQICALANKTISENGFNYSASARVGPAFFENREYDDFTLPAGEYTSLIITLGEGKGKNWWCVIFPAVCLPAADDASLTDTVSKESANVAENPQKYVMKFKFAEWYEKIKHKF